MYTTGSIRAAARHLETAPSAVSRQVAELERRLRTPLLERTARGVRATEAGHALARFAQERIDLDESLLDELDQLRDLHRGRVHLASGEGFVDDVIQHGLTDFFSRYPGVRVTLTTGGTGAICAQRSPSTTRTMPSQSPTTPTSAWPSLSGPKPPRTHHCPSATAVDVASMIIGTLRVT